MLPFRSAFVACPVLAMLVSASVYAKGPKAKGASKPWDAPGWAQGVAEKARASDAEYSLVKGGKESLFFAGQKDPRTNLDPHFQEAMVEVVSGRGEKMGLEYQRHDYLDIRKTDSGKIEVWKMLNGGQRQRTPVSGRSIPDVARGPGKVQLVDASTVKAGCAGMITALTPQPVWVSAGVPLLRLFAASLSGEHDSTLLIGTPAGEILCSDDDAGKDALIELKKPAPGMYSVWVGRDAWDADSTLYVSADAGEKFPTAQGEQDKTCYLVREAATKVARGKIARTGAIDVVRRCYEGGWAKSDIVCSAKQKDFDRVCVKR